MYDDLWLVYREEVSRYAEAASMATQRELAATLTVDAPVAAVATE